ncbi:MAG: cell division protein FtsL [Gammaproteobacteria bacterium]|jgi:cell division protein FtsL
MNFAVKTSNRITILPRSFIKRLSHLCENLLAVKNYTITIVLTVALLISSFGVICVQNINRQLTNKLQILQTENINLRNQWSQLLLEKSTWDTATRIEQIARHKLNMTMPKTQQILIINNEK